MNPIYLLLFSVLWKLILAIRFSENHANIEYKDDKKCFLHNNFTLLAPFFLV